jgi:hypothetical protein
MILVNINGKPFKVFETETQAEQFMQDFQKKEIEELKRAEIIEQMLTIIPFNQAQEVLRKIMEKK